MHTGETLVDLIRHGEPEGGRRFRGETDDPLSETGWRQMQASVGKGESWQAIATSPLRRCAEFANTLGERLGIPVEQVPDLKEMAFGAWEGRTASDILAEGPGDLAGFWEDPENGRIPEGESLTAFRDRVVGAWQGLVARYAGHHLLIVAHGGVVRVLLTHVLGMPPGHLFRLEVAYADRSRIRVDSHGPRLVAHGSHE